MMISPSIIGGGQFIPLQVGAKDPWQVEAIRLTRSRLLVYDSVRDSVLVFVRGPAGIHDVEAERAINAVRGRPSTMVSGSDTSVLFIDKAKRVVRVLHERGQLIGEWHLPVSRETTAACLANDTTLAVFARDANAYRAFTIRGAEETRTESEIGEPWDGYNARHWLAGHVLSSVPTPSGACTFAHAFELGIVLLTADGTRKVIPYIESLPAPKVIVATEANGDTYRKEERTEGAILSARSIATSGDSLLVLFAGTAPAATSRIDVYDLESGTYRHTWRFANRFSAVSATGDDVAFLTRSAGRLGVWIVRLGPVAGT
ncbi:hypothetical protein [Gemmatimonas sp.]|uniref:hypothetical protein n=1 Tax=Gemmatimonas sp. TaxID=1962908 RepID=UPI0031BC8EF3|nr:hypothetical protein [Gemmatimonas sp.]